MKIYKKWLLGATFVAVSLLVPIEKGSTQVVRNYSKEKLNFLRNEAKKMFYHAYNGYLQHAYPYDELKPISCQGVDTWGNYSLTLIDALDTLAIMGNHTEFQRIYHLIAENLDFNNNVSVSVFETNIRVLGGLLSGHLLAKRSGVEVGLGWPCEGPLLSLAENLAQRLLPAFDTPTGMPFGSVNLKYGVSQYSHWTVCTACIGTYIVEFGTLSRLTGNPLYENVAMKSLTALWKYKSDLGLVGNHIDVKTGDWAGIEAGIGGAIDSYYEYLVKGSVLLSRPELMQMFQELLDSIEHHMNHEDWHYFVTMADGIQTSKLFESLVPYWSGLLSLMGKQRKAKATIQNYYGVLKKYGFLPEHYDLNTEEPVTDKEFYNLRPELVESAMYLYQATGDPFFISIGEDLLHNINFSARTQCGYATIGSVKNHSQYDRMESFFLAETTKYLYLLFDPENFVHNKGAEAIMVETKHGKCIMDSGGYIFSTEAHPVDTAALKCCSKSVEQDVESFFQADFLNLLRPETVNELKGDFLRDYRQKFQQFRDSEENKKNERVENFEQIKLELKVKEERKEKILKEMIQDEMKYDDIIQQQGDEDDLLVDFEEDEEEDTEEEDQSSKSAISSNRDLAIPFSMAQFKEKVMEFDDWKGEFFFRGFCEPKSFFERFE